MQKIQKCHHDVSHIKLVLDFNNEVSWFVCEEFSFLHILTEIICVRVLTFKYLWLIISGFWTTGPEGKHRSPKDQEHRSSVHHSSGPQCPRHHTQRFFCLFVLVFCYSFSCIRPFFLLYFLFLDLMEVCAKWTLIFPFRAADRPTELVREHLQSEQHHQSLQRRQPEGTGGQEEEEKELGEDVKNEISAGQKKRFQMVLSWVQAAHLWSLADLICVM